VSDAKARPSRHYQAGPHIYLRGKIWQAYLPGRLPVSLRTSDRAEADRRFGAILAGTVSASNPGADPRESAIAVIVAAFEAGEHGYTRRTRRSATNRTCAFLTWCNAAGVQLPSQLTPERVDAWITERSVDVSRRTINRDLRVIRVMFRWASARGLCGSTHVVTREDLREPKREKRHVVPDPTELHEILADLRLIHVGAWKAVRALCVTGLRIEELRRLNPFDLRSGVLIIAPEPGAASIAEPGKGYETRRLVLDSEAQEIMREFFAWRAGPRTKCSEGWLLRYLHQACDDAGIERCGLHDLRRHFCTEAVNAGIPLRVVSRWLGHKDVQTTERYIAVYRSDAAIVAPVPAGVRANFRPNAKPIAKERKL
jgi:integrase